MAISRWWGQHPAAAIGIATGDRSGILVIDIDRRHDGEQNFENLVVGRALPDTPQCLTGDGRHLYFTCPDASIGNSPIAPGVDVRGLNGYVVAPPSTHISGNSYRWDPRADVQDIAAPPSWFLNLVEVVNTPYEHDSRSALRANPRRPLSAKIAALLEQSDASGDYHSRSEVVQAITAGARRQGWTFEELLAVLLEPSNLGGEKIQQRAPEDARRYLLRSWKKAELLTPSPLSIASTDSTQLEALEAALSGQQWSGTTGSTDWAVMQALLGIVARTGKTEISASAREVAEVAGVIPTTASKALRRLQHRRLITLVQSARDGLAAVYRLQHDDTQYTDTPEGDRRP